MATKVTLRQKPISKGRKSLYLDFYPPIQIPQANKTTRREFLGLYIYNRAKNPLQKEDNKQTLLLAEQIRQKRDNELNKPEVYTAFELEQLKIKEKGELSFIDYYNKQTEKRNGRNYDVWISAFNYLKDFTNGALKFNQLNEKFCNDYKDYLLNTNSKRRTNSKLSQNTAVSYFNKFKATLKQAYKDNLLPNDLNAKITAIKQADTGKVFLTIDEVNLLVKTECPYPLLKRASLFSILTGLRFSDIQKLKWSEIIHIRNQEYLIQFRHKKTTKSDFLPIPKQAFDLLGTPQDEDDNVFKGLKYSAYINRQLLVWTKNAGIKKHITFHSFRHTYATLQLQGGTDIYTVSKMLGHKDLKTTQVYAKIVDKMKQEATEKIKLNF